MRGNLVFHAPPQGALEDLSRRRSRKYLIAHDALGTLLTDQLQQGAGSLTQRSNRWAGSAARIFPTHCRNGSASKKN